jgi:ubiquinone/menaquinone biosynthesis C-methylase UbiE
MGDAGSIGSMSQFALPHGRWGRFVGQLMAVGNADMERAAIDAVTVSGTERILELGFGPGVGIARLARALPRGHVIGVDPSNLMLAQAGRRNRRAIKAGRVELYLGTASQLPWGDEHFDVVVSVNNIQEWPSLADDLREVHRVLRVGGELSIAVHAWVDKFARDRGDAQQPWREHIETALTATSFRDVCTVQRRARSGKALYFTARR